MILIFEKYNGNKTSLGNIKGNEYRLYSIIPLEDNSEFVTEDEIKYVKKKMTKMFPSIKISNLYLHFKFEDSADEAQFLLISENGEKFEI